MIIRLASSLLSIAIVAAIGIAGYLWFDGAQAMSQAERSGWLTPAPDDTDLSTFETTAAKAVFGATWDETGFPCRTAERFARNYIVAPDARGLSISQVLARDIVHETDRSQSLHTQLRQLSLACLLERDYSDTQLMRLWLKRASFGQDLIGPEAAAKAVFNKPPDELDAEESAKLTALLSWPDTWNDQDEWPARADRIAEVAASR